MRRVYRYNGRPVDRLEDVKNRYDDNGRLVPDGVPDPAKATHSENLFQREAVAFIRRNRDRPFFRDVAGDHPDVVEQFLTIFDEDHVPSEWYVNPCEGKDQVAAKRQTAQAANGMQVPVGPNTRRSPW